LSEYFTPGGGPVITGISHPGQCIADPFAMSGE
jgi:hypothetical protein